MKNKLFIFLLLVVFVSVIFTSCGGDNPKIVKEVKVESKTIPATTYTVGETTITLSPVREGYILSWEAKGKNVDDFEIYASLGDKASIFPLTSYIRNDITVSGPSSSIQIHDGTPYTVYSYYGSSGTANSDPDKWSAWVSKSNNVLHGSNSYYFGVRTVSGTEYSNIRWTKEKFTLND